MTSQRCYIGLGSNLEQPQKQVTDAIALLGQLPKSRLLASSRLYSSKPLGPSDQPDYINACAALDTELEPLALLDALQGLEQQQGRVRTRHWGERCLDLDLLLYGKLEHECSRLSLPHPQMLKRDFVLLPLQDIAPNLILAGQPLAHWLSQVEAHVHQQN